MKQLLKRASILTLALLIVLGAMPAGTLAFADEMYAIEFHNKARAEEMRITYGTSVVSLGKGDKTVLTIEKGTSVTVSFPSGSATPFVGSVKVGIDDNVGKTFIDGLSGGEYTFTVGDLYFENYVIDQITSWKDGVDTLYDVNFYDFEGLITTDEDIPYGGSATAPLESEISVPVGKHFDGWDKDFSNVVSNMDVYALYAWNTYDVSFYVYGQDTPYHVDTDVEYGTSAIAPESPYPAPEGQHFIRWDIDFSNVTSDLDVHAVYAPNLYDVSFYGESETPFYVDSDVEHGTAATDPRDADPAVAIPLPEGKYFVEWDKTFNNITSDLDVTAIYEWYYYDVEFYVYGLTEPFGVDEDVRYGTSATAPDGPYPAPEGEHFVRWDIDFSNVTSNLIVNAVYSVNLYDVSFYGEDDEPFYVDSDVEHGTAATDPRDADPAVAIPVPLGKHFVEWDKTFDNITSNLDVNAIFEWNTYDVTFIVFEEDPFVDEDVVYGTSATPPTGPYNAPEGKHFSGWDVDYSYITGDITVTALYEWNTYDVTFIVFGEEPYVDKDVVYGTSATPPEGPYNAPLGQYFDRWDVDYSNITSNLTVTAVYEWYYYTVSFMVPEGAPAAPVEQTVRYGLTADEPDYGTGWPGHEFNGWYFGQGEFAFSTPITSDITLVAQWDDIPLYTVTFYPENGDEPFYETRYEGDSVSKPAVDPVRDHFIFNGWSGNYVFGQPLDDNYNMTALWIFDPEVIITEDPEAEPVVESDGLVLRIGYNRTIEEGQGQLYFNLTPNFQYSNVEWSVISGNSLISVDQNGFVQGINQGNAVVQVTVYYYDLQESTTESELKSITDTVPVQVIRYYPPTPPEPTPEIIIEEEPTPEGAIIIEEEETPLGAIEFYSPYVYGYPDQSFGPTRPVTRAEVATMFAKILNMNFNYPGTPKFNDVDPNAWYYTYVQAIGRTNIFVGTGDGRFMPDQPITRSELATVFAKFLTYTEIGVDTTPVSSITDVTSNYWASPYIYAMYNSGLMVGYPDGSYKPNEYTQRDHVVQMINKLISRPQYFPFFTKYIDITTDFWAFGDIEAATTPFTVQQELPVEE